MTSDAAVRTVTCDSVRRTPGSASCDNLVKLDSAWDSLAQVVDAVSVPHSLNWLSSELLWLSEQLLLWEELLWLLGNNKLLLDWGSKLLWSNDGSWGWLASVDDAKSFRRQFRFLVNIRLGWNLLVNIGLSSNLHVFIGNNLGSSRGCSSKTNQDLQCRISL